LNKQITKESDEHNVAYSKKLPTDLLIPGGKTAGREKQILNAIYILK
jgi:hypothetical protein